MLSWWKSPLVVWRCCSRFQDDFCIPVIMWHWQVSYHFLISTPHETVMWEDKIIHEGLSAWGQLILKVIRDKVHGSPVGLGIKDLFWDKWEKYTLNKPSSGFCLSAEVQSWVGPCLFLLRSRAPCCFTGMRVQSNRMWSQCGISNRSGIETKCQYPSQSPEWPGPGSQPGSG